MGGKERKVVVGPVQNRCALVRPFIGMFSVEKQRESLVA
jgi:hypothetical protein